MEGDFHPTKTVKDGRGPSALAAQAAAVVKSDTQPEARQLGALLLVRGLVSQSQVQEAEAAWRGSDLSLGQVFLTRGLISEAELLSALAHIHAIGIADLTDKPPILTLSPHLPAEIAINAEAVIWKRNGSAIVVATSRPDKMDRVRNALPAGARIIPALASRAQVIEAQRHVYGASLARRAEGRAPQRHSCRSWQGETLGRSAIAILVACAVLAVIAPTVIAVAVFGGAIAVFVANCALKFSAFAQSLRAAVLTVRSDAISAIESRFLYLPTVTIIVPLFQEPEVAGALVDRLCRIDYPRERLDILLCVEEDDPLTLSALRAGSLPAWMRAVVVPRGHPQTKPRALNYALNYARGDIVGIYDAEDRPEGDQLHKVVQRFAEVPADVACLQGRLDYYNARHNWLSRLFTVEYAAWFRVLLPGVQRMGLVVPLGGTTVFLRRSVLEKIGAWDAHNVTEDAELGLRLARAGYRTQIVDTTTFEEANAATLPWIRQRSRWLKGYLITWGAAMRNPAALWRDLGTWRFVGLQVQFLGAVLGFLTAPVLWSFMLKPFGVWHPMDSVMSPFAYGILATVMLTGLIGSIAVSFYACRAPHLRHLRPIAPLVEPYYLFGTVAAWIGLFELVARPFFWAKTTHGGFSAVETEEGAGEPAQSLALVGAPLSPVAPLPSDARGTLSTDGTAGPPRHDRRPVP